MADLDKIQNSVFGGVQFNENKNEVENTSYFDNNNNNNTQTQNENASNVFGTFENLNAGSYNGTTTENDTIFKPIGQDNAIVKQTLWSKIKSFLFQEIDLNAPVRIELTPYQQKVENEINEFLHQEVTFKGIVNFFKWKK